MRRKPQPHKSRAHDVTIRISVNRPITRKQAIYAAWDAIHDYDLYGDGDDVAGDGRAPFERGHIKVKKR